MIVWFLSAALASGVPSSGPPRRPPGPPMGPPPVEHLVERAEEIGLSAEVVEGIRELVDLATPGIDAAEQRAQRAHEALFQAMNAETPDREAVLAASRAVGDAMDPCRELRLLLELDVRALLTPEEWEQLRPPRPPGGPHHGPGPR